MKKLFSICGFYKRFTKDLVNVLLLKKKKKKALKSRYSRKRGLDIVLLHCCQTFRKMKVHNSSSEHGSQCSIILGIKRRDIKECALERNKCPFLLML